MAVTEASDARMSSRISALSASDEIGWTGGRPRNAEFRWTFAGCQGAGSKSFSRASSRLPCSSSRFAMFCHKPFLRMVTKNPPGLLAFRFDRSAAAKTRSLSWGEFWTNPARTACLKRRSVRCGSARSSARTSVSRGSVPTLFRPWTPEPRARSRFWFLIPLGRFRSDSGGGVFAVPGALRGGEFLRPEADQPSDTMKLPPYRWRCQ